MSAKNDTLNAANELSLPKSNREIDQANSLHADNDEMQLVEARTAVILLKNARLTTKNEYTQWTLKNLFQPIRKKDTEAMNVLYLSRSRKRIWQPDNGAFQEHNVNAQPTHDHTYVLTPRTNILTVTQEFRLVYIIDLSASLATVGHTHSLILLAEAFRTMRKSLEGIVQPFAIPISSDEKALIKPLLRLSVMADCSQFASNINVIPMLVDHPTLRVFVQNVPINAKNIDLIVSQLYTEFQSFQADMTNFRKFMKKKRSNMGYNLYVGSEVIPDDGSVLDAKSLPIMQSAADSPAKLKQPESHRTTFKPADASRQAGSLHENPSLPTSIGKDQENESEQVPKEVWGMGKSGANLSRILHAGQFALKLLPHQGQPHLILITDGAVKSNIHDNTFVRQFAEDDITCHVIQLSYSHSFVPGRNFGFVPDTEILHFLVRTTGGSFLYYDECHTINTKPESNDKETFSSQPKTLSNLISVKTTFDDEATDEDEYPSIKIIPSKDTSIPLPNMYHRNFLFRESMLSKQSKEASEQPTGNKMRSRSGREITNKHSTKYNFPWDPEAPAPEDEQRLLKYREYLLPSEFSHTIAARAREGFILQTVTFDDGTSGKTAYNGLQNIEVSDFGAVRKERIQIVMVLHWQPNVVIEYRLRATWLPALIGQTSQFSNESLLLSSNFFARLKAPRAEIFVRTNAEFAHMLQNWDMFRRRTQMMRAVTGAAYLGETQTSPAYVKIERLKAYLVDIIESDEGLKAMIGFNSKFMTSLSGPSAMLEKPLTTLPTDSRGQDIFINAFNTFWKQTNSGKDRARTRCWYDYGCVDMLVGDVSPYMSPKLASLYNQDYESNVENAILEMIQHVKNTLKIWADFESEDGTLVKTIHRLAVSPELLEENKKKEDFSVNLGYPPSFAEFRVRREYGRLITIRILFFNVDVTGRHRTIDYLIHLLKISEFTKEACNYICKRPFSSLLMRDRKHFQDRAVSHLDTSRKRETPHSTPHIKHKKIDRNLTETWYLPPTMWLTSEYIVRDYLKHMTWSWQTDNHQDTYHKENKMMPIYDLAFQFLCQARLDQGYKLVSPRPDNTQFYQEIPLPAQGNQKPLSAIQYFVWKDSNNGKITTELWMEPNGDFSIDQYELVKTWTVEPDRKTISQLVTFDQIHAVGRSKGKGDFKARHGITSEPDRSEEDMIVMMLPQLFDVASVLRANKFLVASFKCPHFECHLVERQPQGTGSSQYLTGMSQSVHDLPSMVTKPNSAQNKYPVLQNLQTRSTSSSPTIVRYDLVRDMCMRPDPILNRCKHAIATLGIRAQNYAILHYLFESSLSSIIDGEIIMAHHDNSSSFWKTLSNAMDTCRGGVSSCTNLISDLKKARCYVKVLDVRSFVVILFPSSEAVAESLSTCQDDSISGSKPLYTYTDVFVFECHRQKPMRPTRSSLLFSSPLDKSNRVRIANIAVDEKVIISKAGKLGRDFQDLQELFVPELFDGQFENSTGHIGVTEPTLCVVEEITKTFAGSFFMSFYAYLIRGYSVDDNDLQKVLKLCDESAIEINIREFVNTMTFQRDKVQDWDEHEQEIQEKFMSIFRYYFEPVVTKNKVNSGLFYYKPPFCRLPASAAQQQEYAVSTDEKIAGLVDLVGCSQTPLLIRLECTFNSPTSENESITIPINSLPMSCKGKRTNGTSFSFEPRDAQDFERFPFDSGDLPISLRLVCLNLPKRATDDVVESPVPVHPFTNPSFIDMMQAKPSCFSALQPEQQNALAETEARIRWLLTEEVIHGLLKAHPVNEDVVQYVEKKLKDGVPFVDFPTSITVPFHFVKDLTESRTTFMDELEKDDTPPSKRKYGLCRVGDYFYVNEDRICNMRDEPTFTSFGTPTMMSSPASIAEMETETIATEGGLTDLSDGLGIRVFNAAEGHSMFLDEIMPYPERPLYWLILVPKERNIQIYFYSKYRGLLDRSTIMDRIKTEIIAVQERTNRLMLLRSLHNTHTCSKFLEEASSKTGDNNTSEDDSDIMMPKNDGAFIFQDKFRPGQFKCPIVCTKRFPLHWRLPPNACLKYLSSDVLRVFKVHNRTNTFVIERDGDILYCNIFEESTGGHTAAVETPTAKPDDAGMDAVSTINEHDQEKTSSKAYRELVVKVHGIELPSWVEREFFDLIENLVVSNITQNEVQQVFLRNPNTKPTRADVDFILATGKPPSHRQVLRIPVLVKNPYALMVYLKQLLLADNIKPFAGPTVSAAIKDYYQQMFDNNSEGNLSVQSFAATDDKRDSEQMQDIGYDEFCYYYNCTNRVPGSSTSLEANVGQGLAGISMVLQDIQGKPMFCKQEERDGGASIDPEMIRQCLEDDFRETTTEGGFYRIWVDIWGIGTTHYDALADHIYDCFRQSLCDYFIEKTVSIDLAEALNSDGAFQRAIFANSDKRIGTALRKKCIESVLYILRKATDWKSRTVCSFDQDIQIAPWCMDGLLEHLDCELQNLNVTLKPTVAWTALGDDILGDEEYLNPNNKWQLYQGHLNRQHPSKQQNIQLVAISGIKEFVEQLGSVSDSQASFRRVSIASDPSLQQVWSRQSSEASIMQVLQASGDPKLAGKTEERPTVDTSRSPSTRSITVIPSKPHRSPKADSNKHCFLLMTLNGRRISIYTYNWLETTSMDIFKSMEGVVNRQKARNDILSNILHQKMGLFQHSESIQDIVEKYVSSASSPADNPSFATIPHRPSVTTLKPTKKTEYVEPQNKGDAQSSAHSTRRNTVSSTVPVANIHDLKDMIVFPTTVLNYRQSESIVDGSVRGHPMDTEDEPMIGWKPTAVKTAELDHALLDSITESVADTKGSKDIDVLRRHGQSFLEMYMRQAKLQIAHEKAMKAYAKWRRRYGVPSAVVDNTANLTRPEVSTILRSSRILHFCRTPLLFCNKDMVWPNVEEGSSNKEKTVLWYKKMANTLIAEYAKYLDKADMQLIDFETTEMSDEEDMIKTYAFDVGENLSIENPSTYLLRVFDGGSLICEIRLTSVFVSVTLYTLHRQYGRSDYNRFVRDSRSKKRLNFQKFEKNCGYFRQAIHINSFVYDFHLRYFQCILESDDPLPPELNILTIIRHFGLVNLAPAAYSKNRILHGYYEFSTDLDTTAFFENLFRDAHQQELLTIRADQTPLCVSVSSSQLNFVRDVKNENHTWRHTLVICPADDADRTSPIERSQGTRIMLEYFILVVYQKVITPEGMVKNNWTRTKKKRSNLERGSSLDEIVPAEEYTLGDLVASARNRIDAMVSQLTVSCKRVDDWSRIYNAKILPEPNDNTNLVQLLKEFEHVNITDADNNMKTFFELRVNWDLVLDSLVLLKHNRVKDIRCNGERHVLIYGARYLDYLVHLSVDSSHSLSGSMVSREDRTNKAEFDSAEKEQIINLGGIFCYYMWTKSSNRPIPRRQSS